MAQDYTWDDVAPAMAAADPGVTWDDVGEAWNTATTRPIEVPTLPPADWTDAVGRAVERWTWAPAVGSLVEGKRIWDVKRATDRWMDRRERPGDEEMLAAFHAEQLQEKSFGYEATAGIAYMVGFGSEFLISGGLTAGMKGMGRAKLLEIASASFQEGIERGLVKKVVTGMASLPGVTARSAARAAIMPSGALASTLQRTLAPYEVDEDEAGDLAIRFMDSTQGFVSSMPAGLADSTIEVLSETAGDVGGILRPIAQFQAKVFGGLAKKVGKGKAAAILKKAGWDGVVTEIGEERLGAIMRAALLDEPWGDVIPTGRQLALEATIFSVPGAGAAALDSVAERLSKRGEATLSLMGDKGSIPEQEAAEAASREPNVPAPEGSPGKEATPGETAPIPPAEAAEGQGAAEAGETPAEPSAPLPTTPAREAVKARYARAQARGTASVPGVKDLELEEVSPEDPGVQRAASIVRALGGEVIFVQDPKGQALPRSGAMIEEGGKSYVIVDATAKGSAQIRTVVVHEAVHALAKRIGLEKLYAKLEALDPQLMAFARKEYAVLVGTEEFEALSEEMQQEEAAAMLAESIAGYIDAALQSQESLVKLMRSPDMLDTLVDIAAGISRVLGFGVEGVTTRRISRIKTALATGRKGDLGQAVPVELALEAAGIFAEVFQQATGEAIPRGKPAEAPSVAALPTEETLFGEEVKAPGKRPTKGPEVKVNQPTLMDTREGDLEGQKTIEDAEEEAKPATIEDEEAAAKEAKRQKRIEKTKKKAGPTSEASARAKKNTDKRLAKHKTGATGLRNFVRAHGGLEFTPDLATIEEDERTQKKRVVGLGRLVHKRGAIRGMKTDDALSLAVEHGFFPGEGEDGQKLEVGVAEFMDALEADIPHPDADFAEDRAKHEAGQPDPEEAYGPPPEGWESWSKPSEEYRDWLPGDPLPPILNDDDEVPFAVAPGDIRSAEFRRWFGDSVVTDLGVAGGIPEMVFHGTTHAPFYQFDRDRTGITNFVGRGFYFTNTPHDAAQNYGHSEGADVSSRVARLAERIYDERRDELNEQFPNEDFIDEARLILSGEKERPADAYGVWPTRAQYVAFTDEDAAVLLSVTAMHRRAKELALGELVGEGPAIMPVYLKIERPWRIMRGEHFSSEDQAKIAEAVVDAVAAANGEYADGWLDPAEEGVREFVSNLQDGLRADGLSMHIDLRGLLGAARYADENGDRVLGEVYQDIARRAGYDGFEMDAYNLFSGMPSVERGTIHYVAFAPTQAKSVFNGGKWSISNPNMLFAAARPDETAARSLIRSDAYARFFRKHSKLPAWMQKFFDYDKWRRRLVDSLWPVEKSFLPDAAAGDNSAIESLLSLRLSRSKAAFAMEVRAKSFEAIGSMFETEEQISDLGLYAIASDALARNKVIRKRNPQNKAGSGMTEKDAIAIMRRLTSQKLETALGMLRAEIELTLSERVRYGLQSEETAEGWRTVFGPTYMPHVGHSGEGDAESSIRAPRPKLFVSDNQKRAMGRSEGSIAENPLQVAFQQAMTVAMKGEANLAMQPILDYLVWHEGAGEVLIEGKRKKRRKEAQGAITFDLTEEEEVLEAMSERYRTIGEALEDGTLARGTTEGDLPRAIVDGVPHYMAFTDPVVTEVLRKFGDVDLSQVDKLIGRVTRWVAKTNTQWSLSFVFSNLFRDLTTGGVYLRTMQGPEGAALFHRNLLGAVRTAKRLNSDGKPPEGWEEAWRVYTEEGGRMSTAGLDIRGEILELTKRKVTPRPGPVKSRAIQAINLVGTITRGSEDVVRLAAVKTGLDLGMTPKEAAMLGRNASVNFGRRGDWATSIGTFYAFANASLQGVAQLASVAAKPAGRRILARVFVAGFMLDMMMALLSDEDEDGRKVWDTIPEFRRDQNLVITAGGDDAVTIPIPHGIRVIWSAGASLSRFMRGAVTGSHASMSIVSGLIRDANPIGGDTIMGAATPTALDTFMEIWANKNWQGESINPARYGSQSPKALDFHSSVSPGARWVAKALSRMTGGDEATPGWIDVYPGTLEHFVTGVAGGAGKDVFLAIESGLGLLMGEIPDRRRVPVLRRVLSHEPRRQVSRLYELREIAKRVHEQDGIYAKSGNSAARIKLREEYGDLLRYKKTLEHAADRYRDLRDVDPALALEVAANATKNLGHIR